MAPKEDPSNDVSFLPAPKALEGNCQCSAIILSSTELPLSITICHCADCQRMSGSPFITWGSFDNGEVSFWDQAWSMSKNPDKKISIRMRRSDIKIGDTPLAHRGSCRKCGSPLFMKYSCIPNRTFVAMGLVNGDTIRKDVVKPKEHIFFKQKAKWWPVAEDALKKWDYFDDDFLDAKSQWTQEGAIRRADVTKEDDKYDS